MPTLVYRATCWCCAVFVLFAAASVGAQSRATDSTAVVATIRAFHDALGRGDSAAVLRLLAPDAVILESGNRENREEYRAHHLPADIQFAQAVPSERSAVQVTVLQGVAWGSSTSVTQGNFRDRAINSVGAELMVLSRAGASWVIRAIHWSSSSRRKAP